jgi:hypothetical protein
MGFAIPATFPVAPTEVRAPATIRAATMLNLVERDRFVFATARRAIAQLYTIDPVTWPAYLVEAVLWFNLPASSGGQIKVAVLGSDIDVRCSASSGPSGSVSLGPNDFQVFTLSGLPVATPDALVVELGSATTGVLLGLWVWEANLTSLP